MILFSISTPVGQQVYNKIFCFYYVCRHKILLGMPKAAIIKHSRYLFASYCLYCMGLTYDDDILYSVLPMYHSAAHVCLGVTITEGNTTVTRKKFSAKKFWEDCVRNRVTVRIKKYKKQSKNWFFCLQCAQYIGEIARYLYATPQSR